MENLCKKTNSKPRKKRKTKRHASSPLNDTERPGKGDCVNVNGYRPNNGGLSTSNNVSNCSGGYNFNFDKTSLVPNMAFSQPFGGFPFSTQSPYPNPSQSPTLPQSMPAVLNNQPPEWASALINVTGLDFSVHEMKFPFVLKVPFLYFTSFK